MINSPSIAEEKIRIPAIGQDLEGVLAYPEQGEPQSTVLLLAPHPHLGGNMENNLIRHLAQRFAEEGSATLRFNYRGVGRSAIELPSGVSLFDYWAQLERKKQYGELLPDAEAAHSFLNQALPVVKKNILIGYSLGAILALQLADIVDATHVVGISPPVLKVPNMPFARKSKASFLYVGGEPDFAFDPDVLESMMEASECNAPLKRLRDCDHFFRQREEEVYQCLAEWSKETP